MNQPQRYIISATLVTSSPLSIQSGWGSEDLEILGLLPEDKQDKPFRKKSAWNAEDLKSCDQLIIRDGRGQPYLPGSSLKGVIRQFLQREESDAWPSTVIDWGLGTSPRPGAESDGREADQGEGGAVIFEDAFLDAQGECVRHRHSSFQNLHRQWFEAITGTSPAPKAVTDYAGDLLTDSESFPPDSWRARRARHGRVALLADTHHLPYWDPASFSYVEQQVAIDRRTGAAGEHKLFTTEVVPAGIPFQVRWIVDHHRQNAKPAVQLLLRALAGFNLDPVHEPISLGSGTQHGWGRMVCLFPSVRVQAWSPTEVRDVTAEEIDVQMELAKGLASPPTPRKPRVQIEVELSFRGPMLVNDPAKVCVLEAVEKGVIQSGKDSETSVPDHVPRVAHARIESDGSGDRLVVTPLIPGTAVKGPIRSQLERILRSLDPQIAVSPHGEHYPVSESSPLFVQELFGYQSHASGLWCSEFTGEDDGAWSKREMVAIDRFTGGASHHAKFDAVVLDRPTLRGVLAVDLSADLDDAAKTAGVMTLMLRDLIEGDIAFGMGDMKSFGQCIAEITSVQVAGLSRCQRLHERLGEAADGVDVKQWLGNVRDALLAHRETPDSSDSSPTTVKQADDLIDEFLQAVRSSHIPDRSATGA